LESAPRAPGHLDPFPRVEISQRRWPTPGVWAHVGAASLGTLHHRARTRPPRRSAEASAIVGPVRFASRVGTGSMPALVRRLDPRDRSWRRLMLRPLGTRASGRARLSARARRRPRMRFLSPR